MNRSIECERAHISVHWCLFPRFLIYTFLQAPAPAGRIFPSILQLPPLRRHLYNTTKVHNDLAISSAENGNFPDLNFQPSNDMAIYAVPINSITVNMHIPIMLQQIVR